MRVQPPKYYSLIRAVLLIFFSILLTGLNAQVRSPLTHANIEWSQSENSSSKYWFSKILGESDAGTFLLRSNLSLELNDDPSGFRTRKFAINYYDANFSLKWEKVIQAPKDANIEKIFFGTDRVILLYSLPSKSNKSLELWGYSLDAKGNTSSPIRLMDLKELRTGFVNFNYAFSKDHLILGIMASYTKRINDTVPKGSSFIHTILLDDGFSIFHAKETLLPTEGSEFEPETFYVASDSSYYLAGKNKDRSGMSFTVYGIEDETFKLSFTRIEPTKKSLSDYMFSFDEKNKQISLLGFYSEQNGPSAAGYIFVSINTPDLSIHLNTNYAFEESVLDDFIGEPKTNDKKEILNLKVNQVIKKNDGGLLLIAEIRFTSNYTYFDFFTKTYVSRTIYHYDNVLLFSLLKDGSSEWKKTLHKKQESQEDGGYYSSFTHIVTRESINLVYNLFEGKLTSVNVFSVSSNGEEKSYELCSSSEDSALIPRAGKQVDSDLAIIPSFRKNRFVLAKISF